MFQGFIYNYFYSFFPFQSVSLCSPGWPRILDYLPSASQTMTLCSTLNVILTFDYLQTKPYFSPFLGGKLVVLSSLGQGEEESKDKMEWSAPEFLTDGLCSL